MKTGTESSAGRVLGWRHGMLMPLLVLSAFVFAQGDDAALQPSTAMYRVIPLSADEAAGGIDINARGQVVFTENVDGVRRAKFYDGNTVRDLGTLGGPNAFTAALNDAGQVAGGANIDASGTVSHAYRWSRQTGMVDIGGPRHGDSSGSGINSQGEISGTAHFGPAGRSRLRGFFWSPQTGMQNIGSLALVSFGDGINDAGTVIGHSGGPLEQSFRWTRRDGIQALTTIYNEFNLVAGINAAGQVVGASAFTQYGQVHAFLWTPREGLLDLGTGTGNRSTAAAINDRGMVVGQVIDFTHIYHGFIWTRETGLTELGAAFPGISTAAMAVNNRGQVVGLYDNRAYVWTRAQGVVDLNARLGGAPDGMVLSSGLAISDNGAIVARGNTGLVLLVPPGGTGGTGGTAPPVPGPITLAGVPVVNMGLTFSAPFRDADRRDRHRATWVWGDGSQEPATVSERNGTGSVSGQHTYRTPGTYTPRLTVTDSTGRGSTVRRNVVIGAALSAPDGQN